MPASKDNKKFSFGAFFSNLFSRGTNKKNTQQPPFEESIQSSPVATQFKFTVYEKNGNGDLVEKADNPHKVMNYPAGTTDESRRRSLEATLARDAKLGEGQSGGVLNGDNDDVQTLYEMALNNKDYEVACGILVAYVDYLRGGSESDQKKVFAEHISILVDRKDKDGKTIKELYPEGFARCGIERENIKRDPNDSKVQKEYVNALREWW